MIIVPLYIGERNDLPSADTLVNKTHHIFLSVTVIKRHGTCSEKVYDNFLVFSNGKCYFSPVLHLKIPLETLSTVEMEDMDTEDNSPPDQYAGLKQQLEILVKESQVQCNK